MIWYKDINILFKPDQLVYFFPRAKESLEERLNAIFRFSIYISCVLAIYHNNLKYLYFIVLFGALTIFIHKHYTLKEGFEQTDNWGYSNYTLFNPEPIPKSEPFPEDRITECTKPTKDNPFMNVTMDDYLNTDENGRMKERLPACDPNNPDIKQQQDAAFYSNLYRDVNDVFAKNNSQREFYTTPSTTIPNKQDEFARWLYLSPKTCKEDSDNCLRYEDIRGKAYIMPNPYRNPQSASQLDKTFT